jgi:hypothetical protein
MSWHPTYSDADPADAWYPPDTLRAMRADEEAERDFRHMLRRRERFESDAERLDDPSPDQLEELWRQADEETSL